MWNSERAFFGPESGQISADVRDARVSAFLGRVYGWMFLGLLVTAGTGMWVASSPGFRQVLFGQGLFWVLGFVQLGMVLFLRTSVAKMAPTTAAVIFMIYAALNGVTTSYIFLVYTATSLVAAFAITAGMFAAMSVFGLLTTRATKSTSWMSSRWTRRCGARRARRRPARSRGGQQESSQSTG